MIFKKLILVFITLPLLTPKAMSADQTLFPIFDSEYQQAPVVFDGSSYHNTKTKFVNLTNEVSVVAWVKTTSNENGMAVLASDDDDDKGRIQLFVNQGANQALRFYLKNDGIVLADVYGYPVDSNISVADGLWHLIVATVDLNDPTASSFYVDGQSINTSNVNGTGGTIDKLATSLYVGANHRVVPSQSTGQLVTNYFTGEIKKVRLYRSILSANDIKDLFDEMR